MPCTCGCPAKAHPLEAVRCGSCQSYGCRDPVRGACTSRKPFAGAEYMDEEATLCSCERYHPMPDTRLEIEKLVDAVRHPEEDAPNGW